MAVGYKHLPVDVHVMDFFFKDNMESHHWAFIYLLLIKMIDSSASDRGGGFSSLVHAAEIGRRVIGACSRQRLAAAPPPALRHGAGQPRPHPLC